MIDLASEKVLTLNDATQHLPRRRGGKRPHISTLIRWSERGVRGIRLEVIRVGGTLCTSLEALQRFCDRLTTGVDAPAPTTRRRRREIAKAEQALSEAGIG